MIGFWGWDKGDLFKILFAVRVWGEIGRSRLGRMRCDRILEWYRAIMFLGKAKVVWDGVKGDRVGDGIEG